MSSHPQPEHFHAHLSWDRLDELCQDLRERTEFLEVQLKADPKRPARRCATDLDAAAQALRDGSARGIRLTYQWEGQLWIDTLLRDEDGFQIFRTYSALSAGVSTPHLAKPRQEAEPEKG